jgi:uncharacterized protein YhbP (UPF0306 family)
MYVFLPEYHALIFSSEKTTKHIVNARLNTKVAGTILPAIMELGIIKGIQFTGTFSPLELDTLADAKRKYYLKYPFALLMKGELFCVHLETVKMTDNKLGIGKKICWELSASHEQ